MQFSYGELCFHAASQSLACLKEKSQCRLLPIKTRFCTKKSLVLKLNIPVLVLSSFPLVFGLQVNYMRLRILLGGMLSVKRRGFFEMGLIPQIWLILESRNLKSASLIDGISFDKAQLFSILDSSMLIFYEIKKARRDIFAKQKCKVIFFGWVFVWGWIKIIVEVWFLSFLIFFFIFSWKMEEKKYSINRQAAIGESSNGRTPDFDSVCPGSNPGSPVCKCGVEKRYLVGLITRR